MKFATETMFDFVTQCSPLAVIERAFTVFYGNGRVGCPYVAGSVNESSVAANLLGGNDAYRSLGEISSSPFQLVPDNTHTLFASGGATGEKQKKQGVSHIRSFWMGG